MDPKGQGHNEAGKCADKRNPASGHGIAVGMRIMRPLSAPPKELHAKYWDADVESIISDVDSRVEFNGRGAKGSTTKELPKLIEKLEGIK